MRSRSCVLVALLIVSSWSASCCTSSGGAQWNQVHGNARNSSYAAVVTQDAGVPNWTRTLWTRSTANDPRKEPNAPVVGPDGTIFVSWSPRYWHGSGRIVGIHPSGQTVVFAVHTNGVTSIPAVADDGRIFAVVHSGTFVGQQSGTAGPTISGTLERVTTLWCWDPTTQAFVWRKRLDYFGEPDEELRASHPKIHRDEIFVVTKSGTGSRLLAFDLDGNPTSSSALPGQFVNFDPRPPAIADELPNGRPGVVATVGATLFAAERTPGQELGQDTLVIDRTGEGWFLGPPVITSGGHIGALTTRSIDVHAAWDVHPSTTCDLQNFISQGHTEALAFLGDQAPAQAYFSSAFRLVLVVGCDLQWQAPCDWPSAPVVTKTHVFVSASDGLHSNSLGLVPASHHVAHVFMNRAPRQPAVGPQGTVYEVVWMETDQTDMFVLRAFGGAEASVDVEE